MAASTLLTTKLNPPPRRAGLVPRPRLLARLAAGLQPGRRLTLVSAPAGFGKTTVAAEWLRARPAEVAAAWLSLDEADSDPARFLAYLRAALVGSMPALGEAAPPLAGEAGLASLINHLAEAPRPVLLVLDDYHVLHGRPVHEQVGFLVEHQPETLHLVIATREDPPLPLARLRAGGQMVELRQAELEFTPAEAAEFLAGTAGLALAPAEVERLHARTEGWIAGLQLAAVSLQSGSAVPAPAEPFAGSHHYILDYLIDEVFRRQPEAVQAFLLHTAVLDRFCADLCTALLAEQPGVDGPAWPAAALLLDQLERANLFIVALDETRTWYRYHHLFADLLRHRLELTHPERLAGLHRRAGRWYADHGDPAEAVRHALAGADWEAAARLIHALSGELLRLGQVATLLEWFGRLPEAVIAAQPGLALDQAWALLLGGQHAAAEARLAQADAGAAADPALPGGVAAARAFLARERGDVQQAAVYSHRALALLPADDFVTRGVLATNLGLGYWHMGRLAEAEPLLREAHAAALQTRNDYARLSAEIFLNRVLAVRGQLRAAAAGCQRLIAAGGRAPILALAHLDLSTLYDEWNDGPAAAAAWETGYTLSRQAGQAEFQVAALLLRARREPARALDLIQQAYDLAQAQRLPAAVLGRAGAAGVEAALAGRDRAAAERWAGLADLEADPHPFFRFLGLTRARLLLARGDRAEAAADLEHRAGQAAGAGWGYGWIAARALQALAAETPAAALGFLGEALTRAEPEGLVRTFLALGEPMRLLLSQAAGRGPAAGYARRLLAVWAAEHPAAGPAPADAGQLEPFSLRELEVLRLLAQGCTNQEISQALFISVNTVKTHLEHIFGKLGVNDRRQAAAQARERGWLA